MRPVVVISLMLPFAVPGWSAPRPAEVTEAMKRAADFFHSHCATRGGYVYFYSEDLARRWGEAEARPEEIWVQSPGTPRVGLAYLAAHEATGDPFFREAARDAAHALLHGQLESGGWRNSIDFDSAGPRADRYRDGRGDPEGRNYWDLYPLNDGVAGTVTDLLIEAEGAYGGGSCRAALEKLGDFLISAQLPDPQPAWAQQYDYDMRPVWARAFEPPAIATRESEDAMIALSKIADFTGDERFLAPIVPAVKYLEASVLPDGRLPRYLELETNRPLYMERTGKTYSLTHDDDDLLALRLEERAPARNDQGRLPGGGGGPIARCDPEGPAADRRGGRGDPARTRRSGPLGERLRGGKADRAEPVSRRRALPVERNLRGAPREARGVAESPPVSRRTSTDGRRVGPEGRALIRADEAQGVMPPSGSSSSMAFLRRA